MSGLPSNPSGRRETYLANIAGENVALPNNPQGREEEYLDYIARNGGGGGGGASIDDSTPAYNKVYSSEKTEERLTDKFDASYATISGGGANLCDFTQSHANWKPGMASGEKYTPGTSQTGQYTTNLWTYSSNEKLKFYITDIPTYFRFIIYDSEYNFLMASGNYTTDTDGYYVVQMKKTGAAYMCFTMAGTENNFNSFNIGRYDTYGPEKLVFDKLYLNDNNIAMIQGRLGLDTPDILHEKKWAVAGDSFSHGDGVTETIQTGPYAGNYAVYPYIIATRHNMTIENFFENGRTLAEPQDGTSTNAFAHYYQNVSADTDYLTIYLGINDSHKSTASTGNIPLGTITDNTTATFYGAWNVILTWLITNRPNLKIGIIVSNACDSDDYRVASIAIATKYGIPYIDMNGDERTPCMIRSTNANVASAVRNQRTVNWRVSSENAHPNAACHAFEATFIEDFLRSL